MSHRAASLIAVPFVLVALALAGPGLIASGHASALGLERAPAGATATFGAASKGTPTSLPPNTKRVSPYTLADGGTVTHLAAYVDGKGRGKGSQKVRFVLYGDHKGAPKKLLGKTRNHRVVKGARGRWVSLPLVKPATLGPDRYHLGIHSGPRGRVARYGVVGGSAAIRKNRNLFRAGPTRVFGRATASSGQVAVQGKYKPDTKPPSAPKGLAVTATTASALTLTWQASKDNVGVAGYRLYRSGVLAGSTTSLSHAFAGLACGTSYSLGVEAFDAAGNTSTRATVNAATSACTGTPAPRSFGRTQVGSLGSMTGDRKRVSRFTLPEAGTVTTISAYVDGNGPTSSGTQVLRFVVYSDQAGNPQTLLGTTGTHTVASGAPGAWVGLPLSAPLPLAAGTYHLGIHSGGTSGVARYAAVSEPAGLRQNDDAFADGATASFGSVSVFDLGMSIVAEYTAAAPDTVPPSLPQGLSVSSATQTSLSLVWNASSDDVGVAGYRLYRDNAYVGTTQGLIYAFAGLACGTSYALAVEAYDAAGNVSARATTTAATSACDAPPPPPPPPPPAPPPPPPGSGLAHLWIDANGGTCTRSSAPVAYDDAKACASAAAAYTVANASTDGSTILIRGGTYPPFEISGSRSSSNRIVFDVAPGETAVFSGGWMRVGVSGAPQLGPRYVTIRNVRTSEMGSGYPDPTSRFGLLVDVGSRFIRFENVSAGGFLFRGAKDVDLIGGDQGPCRRVGNTTTGPTTGPCEINKVDYYPCTPQEQCVPERILIDGVDFHDFNFGSGCSGACHWRAMYLNGVQGFTMRNSTVRNSVFEPWTTISGPDAAARGNRDILIENNYFGVNVQAGGGHGFSFAWCQNASAGIVAYKNVTFRFNSFARGMNLPVPASNNPQGEANCAIENFNVYGNIFGAKHPSCGLAAVAWSYNVYAGTTSGTCGVGDVNVGGTAMPFYQRDLTNPTAWDDFLLVGAAFAADDRVPSIAGCPAFDRLGGARPLTSGFCDAGAHER